MLSGRDANALARKQAEAAMRLTAVAARARGAGAGLRHVRDQLQSASVDPRRTLGLSDRAGRTHRRRRGPMAPFQTVVGCRSLDYPRAHTDRLVPGVVAGKRLEMNRLPASQRYRRRSQRWTRYEKQLSGHQLQVDVKFIEPLGQKGLRRKKFYQFTAIDDCTRLRVLRGYPRCDQRPPSPSSTTPCQSCRSRSSACQKTTVPSSAPRSTGTCSTKASTTSRSNIGRRGSTARCVKTWLGAAPGRSDPGQGVTMVSFVRFVGRLWCSVTARTGQTDLT
jgi:hypothetical protein